MLGLLVRCQRRRRPKNIRPRRLADRALGVELFQALVGGVLPDDDYDANALRNAFAAHAAHGITRVFSTQGSQAAFSPRSLRPNEPSQATCE